RDFPFRLANRARLGQKIRELAGVELRLALLACREQFSDPAAETASELGDEFECSGGENLGVGRLCGTEDFQARQILRRVSRHRFCLPPWQTDAHHSLFSAGGKIYAELIIHI